MALLAIFDQMYELVVMLSVELALQDDASSD